MLDLAVIDCETTGLGEEAQVVEVAVVTRTSVQAFLDSSDDPDRASRTCSPPSSR